MSWRAAALRSGPVLVLAVLLALLLARSSLLRLLPFGWSGLWIALSMGGFALLLLPAVFVPRSPLPALLAVTVPVIAVAAYDQSRLDWLRILRDFGVTGGRAIDAARLAMSLAALLLVWAIHAMDTALRLRWDARERGVAGWRSSSGVSLAASARVTALALLGTALVAALGFATRGLDAGALLGGRVAILAPLVAVALVALAAVLLARGGRETA